MSAVLHHSQAKSTDKLILLGIANHEGDGGAWPTIETLAKYGNCSRSKVKQAISNLATLGEIRVDVQAGGNSETRPDRRPNRYRVLLTCPPTCDGTTQHRESDGGHSSIPREDGGHFSEERGSLLGPTGVTRVTPNRPLEPSSLEPSLASPASAVERAEVESENQRGNRLAKIYTDRVRLSNFPAVAGVVRKAVRAGYDDETIRDALTRLADDGRSVTTDALRYEIEGMPDARRKKSGSQQYLEAAGRLAESDHALAALSALEIEP